MIDSNLRQELKTIIKTFDLTSDLYYEYAYALFTNLIQIRDNTCDGKNNIRAARCQEIFEEILKKDANTGLCDYYQLLELDYNDSQIREYIIDNDCFKNILLKSGDLTKRCIKEINETRHLTVRPTHLL